MSIDGKQVLVVGGTSLDTIVQLPAAMEKGPQTIWAKDCYQAVGGTGAGKALNLAQLGFDVSLHTLVGNDLDAEFVLSELEHPRIELLVDRVEQATERHVNLMDPHGHRISIFTHYPANPDVINWQSVEARMQNTDIAAINILDYTRPTLSMAKKYAKPIWIDLHDYDGSDPYHQDFIDAADVLMVSSEKLTDYKEFMLQQQNLGKELVICTHASDGATLLDKAGNWYQQQIMPGYELVDSNGAGDAFFSGFLYACIQGLSIQQCMRFAATAAAMCINSNRLYSADLSATQLERRVAG